MKKYSDNGACVVRDEKRLPEEMRQHKTAIEVSRALNIIGEKSQSPLAIPALEPVEAEVTDLGAALAAAGL